MSSFSHLPYPSNPALEQLKVLATDLVIYLSPSGNDGTGDGSRTNPYKTLEKGMLVARSYTIVGNATLYIRFLRGEYTLAGTIDLYHPQGGNIIIEGDPAAFLQRTLFQVDSYNWSLQNFAGGGHTGNIRLFDGVTTNALGATMHGFSGADHGMYFTITNAAIGSRDGYISNSAGNKLGVNSTTSGDGSYSYLFHGDRFFNHGFSYEEGEGILGIGRVLAATADSAVVTVQFQNTNIDTRCPVHNLTSGGILNTNTWANLSSNYPENQYSQPVGYYGFNGWVHDTQTISFPSKPVSAVSTITTDPYLLSTYPVVLRGDYGSNRGTLLLKNGTIKAIRNIFFANSGSPYTIVGTGVTGATLNYSQALTVITDQNLRHGGNGTALVIENGTVGIRHLGFYGIGTALAAYGSKVYAYYDTSNNTSGGGSSSQSGYINYATPNTLDNSPVICTTQCKHGIVSKNSTIDLSNSSGLSRNNGVDYRHNGSYISTTSRSVDLVGSNLRANSMHINCDSDLPKFSMRIIVPIFGGMTVATGGSASFPAFEDNNVGNYWSTFPTAKVFISDVGAATEKEIAYVNYVVDGGSIPGSVVGGSTAAAGVGLSASGSLHATDYRYYTLYGWKLAPDATAVTESLKYVTIDDIRLGITANGISPLINGGTLSVRFYKDSAASGVSAEYIVNRNSVLVSGFNGVRQGYITMNNATSPAGVCAAPLYVNSFNSSGGSSSPSSYMNATANALSVLDNSNVTIEKSLNITNGGYIAVDVRGNSTLNIGDTQASSNNSNANPSSVPTDNFFQGALSVRNYGLLALSLLDNCRGVVGNIFAKHPLHGDGAVENSNTSANIEAVRANNSSTVRIGAIYSIGISALTISRDHNGSVFIPASLFTSRSGREYGLHSATSTTESHVHAKNGSSIFLLSYGSPESIFSYDGGSVGLNSIVAADRVAMIKATGSGTVFVNPTSVLATSSATTWVDSNQTSKVIIDTRSTSTTLTRSGSNFLYNRVAGNRAWRAAYPTSPGFTACALNLGGNADGSAPVTIGGLTFTSYTTNLGRIIKFET